MQYSCAFVFKIISPFMDLLVFSRDYCQRRLRKIFRLRFSHNPRQLFRASLISLHALLKHYPHHLVRQLLARMSLAALGSFCSSLYALLPKNSKNQP
jgi:hypothetical protein